MKKYITIVVFLAIGITMASVGFVSAGHDPVNPDETYIHVIGSITTHDNGQICIEDMGENLNKITVTQATVRNTTFYHYRTGNDVRIHVPELYSDKIVVYSNGENSLVNSLTGVCTTLDVTDTLVVAEYYLTLSLEMPQGVEIVSGPNVADNPPAPGSGGASLSATSDSLGLSQTTTTDGQSPDDKLVNFDRADKIVDNSSENTTDNETINEPVDESVDDTVDEPVEDTEEEVDDVAGSVHKTVESVQSVVETVLGGDSVSVTETSNDDTVLGSVGMPVGLFGLVVVYMRRDPG